MWYVLTFILGVLVGAFGYAAARVTGYTKSLRKQIKEELKKLRDEIVRQLDGEAQKVALDLLKKVEDILFELL